MIRALLFDQDGTIIDTERDGHRVSFNRTFAEFGFSAEWDVATYHRLLQIAGGKERMKAWLHEQGFGKPVDPAEEDELIKRLHKRKTDLFVEMLEGGELPLRPGVARLMREAKQAGLTIGICTTSNEKAAEVVADRILGDIGVDFVLAGDIVKRKKPDPEIYLLALERTKLAPEECLVVEDSVNGVRAAKAAGMPVVATSNEYTEQEDLSAADLVLTSLGDPDGERAKIRQGAEKLPGFDGVLRLEQLLQLFG